MHGPTLLHYKQEKVMKIQDVENILCDPAIPLLDIYLKESKTLIQKGICTPMLTAAVFTIVKI